MRGDGEFGGGSAGPGVAERPAGEQGERADDADSSGGYDAGSEARDERADDVQGNGTVSGR